jgi:hypothetical protein
MMSLEYVTDIILPVDSVLGILPWVKDGRRIGLTTLSPSCANCREIWETQPGGTLSTCTEIAIHLPIPLPFP